MQLLTSYEHRSVKRRSKKDIPKMNINHARKILQKAKREILLVTTKIEMISTHTMNGGKRIMKL